MPKNKGGRLGFYSSPQAREWARIYAKSRGIELSRVIGEHGHPTGSIWIMSPDLSLMVLVWSEEELVRWMIDHMRREQG